MAVGLGHGMRRIADHDRAARVGGLAHGELQRDLGEEVDATGRALSWQYHYLFPDEHAEAIIESFLSYVRTDSESVEDSVDFSALAASAARLAGLPTAQVRVAAGVHVRGNATMLQRLLGNLLDNAVRHGAPPVTISLTIDRGTRQAIVIVEDHGPGIVDPKRLLQPFERGDASRAQAGAGLGLAIVARIVERHAGTLAIEEVVGGGTRVIVRVSTLP